MTTGKGDVVTSTTPRAAELSAKVIRCGCSPEQKARPDWHARQGMQCPNPRRVEDLGRIAAFYRNPLRMFAWRLSQLIRGRRPGVVSRAGD